MRLAITLCLLVSCKSGEKQPDPAPAEPAAAPPTPAVAADASAPAPTAPDPAPATPATTGKAPAISVKDLQKKKLTPFVDAKRGVWVVAAKAERLCGPAVAKQVAGWNKRLASALGVIDEFPDAFECEPAGDRTACKFEHPAPPEPEDGSTGFSHLDHESFWSFVFAAGQPGGRPVLAGVVLGPGEASKVPLEPCP